MTFRPLSQRNSPDSEFDGPHDGIPTWMYQSVCDWIDTVIHTSTGSRPTPSRDVLLAAETALHVRFDWSIEAHSARTSALNMVARDGAFGLDLLDFLVSLVPQPRAVELNTILGRSSSLWEVRAASEPRKFELVRRAIGPVAEAIEDVRPASERAHAHLTTAWIKLMGRNPDPSTAYREAIRAVEVVAAPVVTPNDKKATLGKIISVLRAKPEKWTVDLAEATPERVADMAAMIWQSQFDRHGTHDESVPLNVSQEQADAAVHMSIALTRLFAGGHIRPV